MPTSATASPLGQRVQRILLEQNGAPLSLLELQTRLRREGQAVSSERLRLILADSAVFTVLANDRYVMRDELYVPVIAPAFDRHAAEVYLSNLPLAQANYTILDIETTGLKPESDQIIQLAALNVCAGRLHSFRAWYFACDPVLLSPALRRKLHFTDEMVAQVERADPLVLTWPEVRAFLGDGPLVIHNARFDIGFLHRFDPQLPNPVVDTLELALLVAPEAKQHNLAALAAYLDIDIAAIPTAGILGVPPGHHVAFDTLHDAITDVLVLAEVYRALLIRWLDAKNGLTSFCQRLLPEAYGHEVLQRVRLGQVLPGPVAPKLASASDRLPDALALLDRFAEHYDLAARSSQRTMVGLVADAFETDSSRLIEAPTGTGKTLGYLIPAVVAAVRDGRRIALATAFKNLQDQLCHEISRLQAVVPFGVQMLKGAASYLCLRDLQAALDDVKDADLDRRYVLAFLTHWAARTEGATLDELPFWLRRTFAVTAQIEHEVAVDRSTCTERHCPFFDRCHYFMAYRRADQSQVLLINQSLWLAEPAAMPPFDALVIDEAHNLEDMATSALREEVSETSLRRELYRLHVPGTRRGVLQRLLDLKPDTAVRETVHALRRSISQSLRLIEEFRTTVADFVVSCDERLNPKTGAQLRLTGAPDRVHPTRWMLVQQALNQIWRVYLVAIVRDLETLMPAVPNTEQTLGLTIDSIRTRLVEQEVLLRTILEARRGDLVSWIAVETEGDDAGWGFHTAPISVAALLADRYAHLRTVILTSATLTTGPHDFGFFLDRLGLRGILGVNDVHVLEGTLPYHSNVLLGLPTYLSYTPAQTTLQSFVQEFADELSLLCGYTDGRALVLFTARTRLEAVWERNSAKLEMAGIPVLAQREGESRQRLVDELRERGNAVLYGLKSFWEGVDVPGDALSFVIMEKLPYPALEDPIRAARREAIARQSGRDFQDYLFPLMVIQFKQGFGRLLRRESDRGAVILYDKRVARKRYLPELLGALPGFQPRDLTAERSRRSFYELIAARLPGLVDVEAKAGLLAEIPDILLTDLEALVERLAIPDPLPDDAYEEWRPQLLQALHVLYGHEDFRSQEQEAALRAMLMGTDVVAVLPTGAGKSLCFQLPALLRSGTTIICSPLIALMRDQIDKLHDRGIEIAAALMSGQGAAEREEVLARVRVGRVRLLYLAPERLRDPVVLAALAAAPIRQIVVDEAHCVALWGPSFRPDFLMLPHVYQRLACRPPVAAFTATATPQITSAIVQGLALEAPAVVRAPIDRPELRLVVLDQGNRYHPIRSKNDQIRRLMLLVQVADARGESMLIYVSTTKEAENLARVLQVAGYGARAYHGRMPIQERATVGELFMEGLLSIVVCTKAFGMGIDKPDIRYVVHFNVPGDLESYAQEVGRAGRDGASAYGVLLYHPSDERIQRFFIDQSRPDGALLANLWHWLCKQPATLTLDPQEACDRFDIDELDLKRAIYLLERARVITRGADVTLRGTLTLLGDWEAVLERAPEEERPVLEQLRDAVPALAWSSQEVVLPDIAANLGLDVTILEQALINLAVAGGCLYRPWEKGYGILRLVQEDVDLPPVGLDIATLQEQKLVRMRAYVQSRGCRWQALRRYFGEDEGQSCGTCDRCEPEQRYPWSGKTARDVPDPSAFVDLGTVLLEVVDWNERRAREGAAPFGVRSLVRILRGDEYILMRHYPSGPAADARRRVLRSCPFWGVCRTLRRSQAQLDALFERLMREGYAETVEILGGDGNPYTSARITDRGRAQMLSGERLGWD